MLLWSAPRAEIEACFAAGPAADVEATAEALLDGVITAGDRLLDALRLEDQRHADAVKNRTGEMVGDWIKARRHIDACAGNYMQAVPRLREEVGEPFNVDLR